MSIYASTLIYDHEYTGEPGSSPLAYRGSHLWPDAADRGGNFGLAEIPGYVTRGGRVLDDSGHRVWPWLRVSLIGVADDENRDSVLLDADQVRQLRDMLTDWLDRVET